MARRTGVDPAPAGARAAMGPDLGAKGSVPLGLFLTIGSLSLFGPLCIDMYIPALPRLTSDLHASASAIQLSLTACLIGLGLGQLLIGPLSDRFGRRRPLLIGLTLFIVASIACSFSGNPISLCAFRFLEGFGGAAGTVISRAVVRDLFVGTAAARLFSMLMLVTGAGPIFAPQIGAGLLHVTSWRGIFVVLALAGGLILTIAALRLPETLPPERRSSGTLRATIRTMTTVATDRVFYANALACALGVGAIFAYISGSSFVLQNVYHLSPQIFSVLFGINGCGLVIGAQINGHLVGRLGPSKLLTASLVSMSTASMLLLVSVVAHIGLAGVLPCLFAIVFSMGFLTPNAMALALNNFPSAAGSAAALVGLLQFSVGAIVAPLVGIGGKHDALPMAVVMVTMAYMAIALRLLLARGGRTVVLPVVGDVVPATVSD